MTEKAPTTSTEAINTSQNPCWQNYHHYHQYFPSHLLIKLSRITTQSLLIIGSWAATLTVSFQNQNNQHPQSKWQAPIQSPLFSLSSSPSCVSDSAAVLPHSIRGVAQLALFSIARERLGETRPTMGEGRAFRLVLHPRSTSLHLTLLPSTILTITPSPTRRCIHDRRLWRRPPRQHLLDHPRVRARPAQSHPIKILLTSLRSYFPGHIHAFYLEYVYFERRDQGRMGSLTAKRAPGIYSENVQHGGMTSYGTVPT